MRGTPLTATATTARPNGEAGQDKDAVAGMLNTDFAWPTNRPVDPTLAELSK
jgi:hypothetical protein